MAIEDVAREEILTAEASKPVDPRAEFLREINEGNDQALRRDDVGDLLLTKYGIPADQWKLWATAAGLPNAKWDDPAAATQVATWAYDYLWNQFGGNLGLMAIGWRYGAGAAHQIQELHGDSPANSILQRILGAGGAALVESIISSVSTAPPPATQQRYLPGSQGGEVNLTFTLEEGELFSPEQKSQVANPVHTALAGILSNMADKTSVGGPRMTIEDVELQQVPRSAESISAPEPVEMTEVNP